MPRECVLAFTSNSTCLRAIFTLGSQVCICKLLTFDVRVCSQSRQSLEKAKTVLEEERMNLSAELKTLQGGKMESERGRKRAEGQLQELNARLAQAERERVERDERLSKLQVEMGLSTKATTFIVFSQSYLTSEFNILVYGKQTAFRFLVGSRNNTSC